VLPPIRVLWRDAVRAGLFAACGWEMGRVVLASFVIGTRYTSAYGIVGSFLAVLLWCYYAVSIILMGAEYLKETSAHDQAARKSTATETPEVVTPHAKPELLHSADDVPPGGEIPRAPPAADVRSR
jgi:membrane protein